MNPSTSSLPLFAPENRFMVTALAVSVVFHAILLAIRFVAPDSFHFKPADTGLEVILVNAKHAKAPIKADAIAQANLEGGGNADAGRATSPLPDLRKIEDGDDYKIANQRIESLEKQQQEILSQAKNSSVAVHPLEDNVNKSSATPVDGKDPQDSKKVLARTVAEIEKRINDENKRPRKTIISPNTRAEGYARYEKDFEHKIEQYGTLNFPQADGKKLYGKLLLSIPIFQDGSIYEGDGGIKIEQSSGIPALDQAAIRIVKRSAPFGHFPPTMRSKDRDDVLVVVTHFKFTREEKLETELREAK
ncbi:MAG: TonB C-terminal domain-containing protein [Burkholderiales bacterium]|nr:TonB C-terminal domain-containing protein [Burkholderiales bacterium]